MRLKASIEPSCLIMPCTPPSISSGRGRLPSIGTSASGLRHGLVPDDVVIRIDLPSGAQFRTVSLPVAKVSCFGSPPVDGIEEDVGVAEAIARERDPAAVRREARERVARDVRGEPLRIRSVLVRDPDVAVVAEDELALADVRIAGELDGLGGSGRDAGGETEHEDAGRSEAHGGQYSERATRGP